MRLHKIVFIVRSPRSPRCASRSSHWCYRYQLSEATSHLRWLFFILIEDVI